MTDDRNLEVLMAPSTKFEYYIFFLRFNSFKGRSNITQVTSLYFHKLPALLQQSFVVYLRQTTAKPQVYPQRILFM